MQGNDELAGLNDIFIPEKFDIGFFPPAIGWWLVLLFVVLCVATVFLYKRYRLHSVRGYCLQQLSYLEKDYDECHDLKAFGEGVSVLLKRYALLKYGREEVANLYGASWKDFLKKNCDVAIDHKALDIIVNAAYCPAVYEIADIKEFDRFVRGFIRR